MSKAVTFIKHALLKGKIIHFLWFRRQQLESVDRICHLPCWLFNATLWHRKAFTKKTRIGVARPAAPPSPPLHPPLTTPVPGPSVLLEWGGDRGVIVSSSSSWYSFSRRLFVLGFVSGGHCRHSISLPIAVLVFMRPPPEIVLNLPVSLPAENHHSSLPKVIFWRS